MNQEPTSSGDMEPAAPRLPNPNQDRLKRLTQVYLDIADADGPTSSETLDYIRRGGSISLCLNEILVLSETSPTEQHLDELRSDYIDTLFKKASLLSHSSRAYEDTRSDELQAEYVDGVVDKITAIIDAKTPDGALAVGQLPSIVKDAEFSDDGELSMEGLAGTQLYLLVDTALKEHIRRRQLIESHRKRSLVARVAGNRIVRLTVATGIFAASLSPKTGFLPRHDDALTNDINLGLRTVSALSLTIDLPEVIRLKYLGTKNAARSKKLHNQLSETQHLCDLAMRVAYSSSGYGGSGTGESVTGRSGTEDKAENLRRFEHMDANFIHLNNDPGGKPYTADQALGYSARLLVERADQLAAIIEPSKTAAQKRQLYLELCQQILTEDVRRMKKGLNVTRLRRRTMRVLGILPALILPREAGSLIDASAVGQDAAEVVKTRSSDADEEY